MVETKPFLKWVGGKRRLIPELKKHFPSRGGFTYVEPFVGGGSVLLYVLENYFDLDGVIISDLNENLIETYRLIVSNPHELMDVIDSIDIMDYYGNRDLYNHGVIDNLTRCALFIVLNKTCFNGLYRVNKKGLFNSPVGGYDNPKMYDRENILKLNRLLSGVKILSGNYTQTEEFMTENTFFYLDPPYSPISATSSFTSYTKESFQQSNLRDFCIKLDNSGCGFVQSNSNSDEILNLYSAFDIHKVLANRSINSNKDRRGKITEVIIKNKSTFS